jgi:EPS-associated MarR family transcriptional regulator
VSQDDLKLKVLRALEQNPSLTQRQLSSELGVSLGGINYCLKALIDVGWVKVGNFARTSDKRGYVYLLTPQGIKEKAALTSRFLKRKMAEYESIKAEIADLEREVASSERP